MLEGNLTRSRIWSLEAGLGREQEDLSVHGKIQLLEGISEGWRKGLVSVRATSSNSPWTFHGPTRSLSTDAGCQINHKVGSNHPHRTLQVTNMWSMDQSVGSKVPWRMYQTVPGNNRNT